MDLVATDAPMAADVLPFLKVLADESRLTIIRLLALTDLRAGELVARLQIPQNALSYHLKQLRAVGLLQDHRSSGDARDIYYRVNLDRLHTLYQAAGAALHPGFSRQEQRDSTSRGGWHDQPLRVLFLCTHNSARSQLAEGILRYLGGDQVVAYSAGSAPLTVHPYALRLLTELGLNAEEFHAKSLDGFLDQSFDYIITVCDRVRDRCPVFPDDPQHIHWSIPDPLTIEDANAQWKEFCRVQQDLLTRVRYLLQLPHPATGQVFQCPLYSGAQGD